MITQLELPFINTGLVGVVGKLRLLSDREFHALYEVVVGGKPLGNETPIMLAILAELDHRCV